MFWGDINVSSITKEDQMFFVKAVRALERGFKNYHNLPVRRRFGLECHSVCRALALIVPELKVVDGWHFGLEKHDGTSGRFRPGEKLRHTACPHSWLETPDETIIDPHPIGYLSAGPVIVVTRGVYASFAANFYSADNIVTESKVKTGTIRRSRLLANLMRES
jgi:hypothetical protein